MKKRYMIDLETGGTKPGAAIFSVGAVIFDEGEISHEFSMNVQPLSCERYGLTCEIETVMWWLEQSEEAKVELGGQDAWGLDEVLIRLQAWMCSNGIDEVWSCAASFDLKILEYAFEAVGLEVPWEYYQEMCFRTMKQKFPDELFRVRPAVKHVALEDARAQAKWLMNIEEMLEAKL